MLRTVGNIVEISFQNHLICCTYKQAILCILILGSSIINTIVKRMEELNNKVHNLAFDVAFLPLKCKINSMSSLQVRMW